MQLIDSKYEILEKVGQGHHSEVFLIRQLDGKNKKPLAAKRLSKVHLNDNDQFRELFTNEVQIMKTIKHENILSLNEICEDMDYFYLITEYYTNGDLETYISTKGDFSEKEAIYLLKQIMSAFIELHSKKVIHRDIKPANIYLTDNYSHLVIGDFGFANMGNVTTTSKIGTPYYMAPEVLFARSGLPYTSKCDLFSIGVIYYQMLFGNLPFPAVSVSDLEDMIDKFSGESLPIPSDRYISDESVSLLKSLMQKDPIERLSWKHFFNHALFAVKNLNDYFTEIEAKNEKAVFEIKTSIMNKKLVSFAVQREKVSSRFSTDQHLVTENPDIDYAGDIWFEPASEYYAKQEDESSVLKYTSMRSDRHMVVPHQLHMFDIYTHARNKHRFVLTGSKRGRNILKCSTRPELNEALLVACYLLAHKASKLSKKLNDSYTNKENLFGLANFTEAFDTLQGHRLKQGLKRDSEEAEIYMKKMYTILRSNTDTFTQTTGILLEKVMSDCLRVEDLDFILAIESSLVAKYYKQNLKELDGFMKRELELFVGECEYSRDINSRFPQPSLKSNGIDWSVYYNEDKLAGFRKECKAITEELAKDVSSKEPGCSFFCNTFFFR
jgi:serine/threonine protein kinase